MLEKALRYLVSLKENKTYEIDGHTYSDNDLNRIDPPLYYPDTVKVGSLDAIVKMIRAEFADYCPIPAGLPEPPAPPVYAHVKSPTEVSVFTRVDDRARRKYPVKAVCEDVNFSEGWREQQAAIIELRSRFLPTEDSEYLLGLISCIDSNEGVTSSDNGVSQNVTARSGVSLLTAETVKPRVVLKPFRTFREVPQPESEFILRLDNAGRVGLMEADGGIWKIEAKENIAAYLRAELADAIDAGAVVVMI